MTRYIDADKLYQKMLDLQGTKRERYLDIDEVRKIIKKQPTEDVTPIIRGKWYDKKTTIKGAHGLAYGRWGCSVCKRKFSQKSNYCPNCGADMRGEE